MSSRLLVTRRYFMPEMPPSGGTVPLSDEEARHAARVMRAQVGDAIILFDGRGRECTGTVESIDKRHCVVKVSAAVEVDREPQCRSHFGIALPKPERAKEMIERLTELGVNRITPLVYKRTQRPPTDSLLTKLRRIVVESSKQCERNVLMMIDEPTSVNGFISDASTETRWIAHPGGNNVRNVARISPTSASVLIGPEGGFTDEEVEKAVESGYEKVGLGERIYRIETAACVLAAHLA